MSGQIERFRCELCDVAFHSTEELNEHNSRLQEPQPTLPNFENDFRAGAG